MIHWRRLAMACAACLILLGCAVLQPLPASSPAATPASVEASPTPAWSSTATPGPLPTLSETPAPSLTPTPEPLVRFAIIGDYGSGDQNAQAVADLVKSWLPDFILTTGDNNYPSGSASSIDQNIGQFYHEYIYPYTGEYGPGGEVNRFFPTLGNHDWLELNAQPYLDYFTLPGNERYYDVGWEPVHVFAMDSDSNEPDGVGASTIQAQWLQERLASSSQPWKIVTMHQPPYSSGLHGSIDWAQWPYKTWGADVVIGGHDHVYERLIIDGFPYFVNGLGGGEIYYFNAPLEGSQVRYAANYGAVLGIATPHELTLQFITVTGEVIDTFTLTK
ncbi:MAG: metallophosphoesterase [Anaerolineales bacterium]|nr:metallophosphoesterase [Anaerolineales bacterium]